MANEESFDRKSNVQVYLRIRPPNREYTFIEKIPDDMRSISINKDFEVRTFAFSKVFTPKIPQFQVCFESTTSVLKAVLNGYNGCVIAYGQTGSGKTFTVLGEGNGIQGILQYTLTFLLSTKKDIYLELSGMEIYMDKIFDVINAKNNGNVGFTYTASRGASIKNLSRYTINTVGELEIIVKEIVKNRRTQTTKMNMKSSRSHAIFTIAVHNSEFKEPAILNIVDLAGSERVKKSQTMDPRAMDETISINTSLSALSKCISSLTKNDSNYLDSSISSMRNLSKRPSRSPDRPGTAHVPYRDSKLTMVLQSALSGKSYLSLIVTLSPDDVDVEESFSALRFASCALKLEMVPDRIEKAVKKRSPEFNEHIAEINGDTADDKDGNINQTGRYADTDNNYETNFTFNDNKVKGRRKYGSQNKEKTVERHKKEITKPEPAVPIKPVMQNKPEIRNDSLVEELRREIEQLKLVNEGLTQENDDLKFEISEYRFKDQSMVYMQQLQEKDFPQIAKQTRRYLLYGDKSTHPLIVKHLASARRKYEYQMYNSNFKAKLLEAVVCAEDKGYYQFVREYIAGKRILRFLQKRARLRASSAAHNDYYKIKVGMGKNTLLQLMKKLTNQIKNVSRLVNQKK